MSGASDPSGGFPHEHGKGKGRAVDFDDLSSSHNYWPFCATCKQLVQNPSNCLNHNHDLLGMALSSSNELLPQSFRDDFQYSGHTDPLTDFSDGSGLFSTLDTGGSSNTVDSFLGFENFPAKEDALQQNLLTSSDPLHWSYPEDQDLPQEHWYTETQDVEMLDNGHIELSVPQQETLNFWLQRCEREQRRPTESEVLAIANLEQLSIDAVVAWFQARQLQGPVNPTTADVNPGSQPPAHTTAPNHEVLSQVSEYAARRAADDGACSNAQSRKADSGRRYRCTVGCGFSTDDLDTWKRHLRNRYPQQFWHCVLCRGTGRKPFICHRRDKIFQHLQKVHPREHQSRYDHLRDQSEIQHEGRFPSQCPFDNERYSCDQTFQSWEEFIQHCLEHLNERIHDGPWLLHFKHRHSEDDDDNANSGRSTSSSSGFAGASSSSRGPLQAANSHSSSQMHSKATTRPSQQQDLRFEDNSNATPSSLIDVRSYQVVRSTPHGAKWLALDYSWASERCAQSKLPYKAGSLVLPSGSLRYANLPIPFKRAMLLTREMGYRYLWVDILCEPNEYTQRREAIYRQAALIIVIVGFKASPDHIWHFTCDYKNLHTVLSWAQDRIWNYTFYQVRNLGQGAYGIVDEVRLRSTRQTFARKVCLSRHDGKLMQPRYLQEIEILQKFDHPNIPKFVAAYVQRRSLNILMLPVAECDLRELLSRPDEWAAKLKFLPRWFLSLARAIEYMHGLSCRHKDIKPANILISGQDVLLSDFGTSQDFSTSDSGSSGPGLMTPKYCAPEVAQKQQRGRKADIFSLGCVFLEMITICLQQTLYRLSEHLGFSSKSHNAQAVYHQQIPAIHSWLKHLYRLNPLPYQERIIHITSRMLEKAPAKRPTAVEICKALSPEHLQYAVQGRDDTAHQERDTIVLRHRFPNPSTKPSRSSTGFPPGKALAPIQGAPLATLRVLETVNVIVSWSSLDVRKCPELSMVPSKTSDRLRNTIVSYTWTHLAYAVSLGHGKDDQIAANFRVAAEALHPSNVSTVVVINGGGLENRAISARHGDTACKPLESSKTTFIIMWIGNRDCAFSGPRLKHLKQSLLPQADCAMVNYPSKPLALPCPPMELSAGQESRTGASLLSHRHRPMLASERGLKKRSALLSRVLKAIQAMLEGALPRNNPQGHGDEANSKNPVKQRQERLQSVWRQIVQGLPSMLTECPNALFPLHVAKGHLWQMLKRKWTQFDSILAQYERKTLLAILSHKSKVAVIVKRNFQQLNISPLAGRNTCPQHGTIPDAPTSHREVEDAFSAPHQQTAGHHECGWMNLDATIRSLPAPSITGQESSHAFIDNREAWHSEPTGPRSLVPEDTPECYKTPFRCEDSQESANLSRLTPTSGAFYEEQYPKTTLASHSGSNDICRETVHSFDRYSGRSLPSLDRPPFDDFSSCTTHERDFADYSIEVGDLGFVPMETIHRTLSRHSRCTCHHNELFPHDPPSSDPTMILESDSDDADSDTLSVCSSSQMVRSFSSSTSLSSLAHADAERSFPPLFNPLRLTAADLDLEVSFIDASEFGEFDLW